MRWQTQRTPEGFNLAFLDIMACGLGAIILIFMLVKYRTEAPEPTTQRPALQAELTQMQQETATVEADNSALVTQLEKLKQELQQQIQHTVQTDDELAATTKEIARLTTVLARLAAQQKAPPQAIPTPAPKPKPTQTEHLLGLRVAGPRILILLDSSASMADERLADIIKVTAANVATKKSAPKWQKTLAIARWIIDRIPPNSTYMIVSYHSTADFVSTNQWLKGSDATARATLLQALQKLYPQNATNLHAALELIKTSAITPTDIYVITDSLPTKGLDALSVVQRTRQCGAQPSKKTTVTGNCRLALFSAAVTAFARSVPATVNTVLLPIEGDPDAAYAYWTWSISTKGMMITPARSWP